ncbi:MAG: AAA family ATPase, partial [Deltaproteobacteria bacterium]|nr:AAA family ATPase [Deltaproteobacteria bacterium]
MRIRRLSLFGFKSFYKPEDILFNDEFTCIVGSNGCGKSNLIDALRWVCGETRPSSLRVKDFDELIFAGTRTIRPLGMAQVSLVLGSDSGFVPRSTVLESDYFRNRFSNLASRSEIEITRRVYKDGEQEYLVNQIPVRLKDVRDLCRYLGLTFRSSSIIAQGEIDKLVDLKPTELRNYIEESCGLMEAVEKLNDSQEKLALAKNNIDKLRDKQSELLSRLNTLRRQLSKFERAKKAREELVKLLSIKKVLLDRELSERVLINEKELRQLNDEKTILANKLSELEQKRQDLLLRLSEFDESNDSQLDVSNIVKDMRNKQTEYQIVQAETSRKEVMRQLLLDEISVLEKELLDLRVKSELNEKKLNEIENAITEMNLQLQKAQLAVVNLERRIKQVVEEVKEVQKNLTCLREEHKALSIKCSQIETGLPNIEKLEHLRLDEYADLLGVIFSGYKDLDYVSDTYELQSNVIYLENRARDFRS